MDRLQLLELFQKALKELKQEGGPPCIAVSLSDQSIVNVIHALRSELHEYEIELIQALVNDFIGFAETEDRDEGLQRALVVARNILKKLEP